MWYTNMSSKMWFQVFYGDYNVLYGPNRVDLSAFKCTSSAIDKPLKRSFGSIYKWLQRGFWIFGAIFGLKWEENRGQDLDPLSPMGGATGPLPPHTPGQGPLCKFKKNTLRSCRPLLGRQDPCRPWAGRPGAVSKFFKTDIYFWKKFKYKKKKTRGTPRR